jgi:ketosteroid isomerase-like protein
MAARNAVLDLEEFFMRSVDAKDIKGLVLGFYAPVAQLLAPNTTPVKGLYAIQKTLEGMLEQGIRSVNLETHFLDEYGEMAYNTGRFTLVIATPDGREIQDTGNYLVVYRRQAEGGWLAVADIFNSDHPAATA